MQRSFIMIKPDAVQRGLAGEIIKRIENKGFRLLGLKMLQIDEVLAFKHYEEHRGKAFFEELLSFITSGPVIAMVWEGTEAINSMRLLMGSTNPAAAAPGTIRGDLAVSLDKNIIHGSDSPEAARREIALFFKEEEILDYNRSLDKWI